MTNNTDSKYYQQLFMKLGFNRVRLRSSGEVKKPDCARGAPWHIMIPEDPPYDGNCGLMVPPGFVVIDVDIKDGKKGKASYKKLCEICGKLQIGTFVTRSPSGGIHVFLRIPIGMKVRGGMHGFPDIDVIGPGKRYVCCPGNAYEGSDIRYAAIGAEVVLDAPAKLLELIEKPDKKVDTADDFYTEDKFSEHKFELRCIEWLEEFGVDERYNLACIAGDLGLSQEACERIMTEAGIPPEDKAEHAYEYRNDPVGKSSHLTAFDDDLEVPVGKERKVNHRSLFVLSHNIDARPPEWLIDGFIEKAATIMLVGNPDSYKSFLAFDWGLSINTGKPWQGKYPVKKGDVVYVSGEGHRGLGRRIHAWCKHNNVAVEDTNVAVSRRSVPLPDQVDALVKGYDELGKEPPSLLIIDTLARNLNGDENSAKDLTSLFQSLDDLRETWHDVTVVVVHHLGKDAARGARGSSAITGNTDAEFHTERVAGEYAITLTAKKMKDAPQPTPVNLVAHEVEMFEKGTSLVLDIISGEEMDEIIGDHIWLRPVLETAEAEEGPTAFAQRIGIKKPAKQHQEYYNEMLLLCELITKIEGGKWQLTSGGRIKLDELRYLT